MRTGADYKQSLHDGRDVWVLGEGPVDDITTHPSTSAMVDEYATWYDRHFDPDWQDILLTKPDGKRPPPTRPAHTAGNRRRSQTPGQSHQRNPFSPAAETSPTPRPTAP